MVSCCVTVANVVSVTANSNSPNTANALLVDEDSKDTTMNDMVSHVSPASPQDPLESPTMQRLKPRLKKTLSKDNMDEWGDEDLGDDLLPD